MSSIEEAVIMGHLRTLKRPAIRAEDGAVARHAQKDGWSYEAYLQELLEVEMRSREQHMASKRLKEARFPELKTLEQIDWNAMGGVSRQKVAQLATCQFIEKAEDVIIGGPIGTGKTHLAIALGIEARNSGAVNSLTFVLKYGICGIGVLQDVTAMLGRIGGSLRRPKDPGGLGKRLPSTSRRWSQTIRARWTSSWRCGSSRRGSAFSAIPDAEYCLHT